MMSILSSIRLADVMNTRVISVPADTTVDAAIREYFRAHMKSSLPVTEAKDAGRLAGLLTLKTALAAPAKESTPVSAIMVPLQELVIMAPDQRLDGALKQMASKGAAAAGSKVFVCDSSGRLVGLASKTDILDAAGERMEFLAQAKRQQHRQQQQPQQRAAQ
jgi:CBS domain-containing protein